MRAISIPRELIEDFNTDDLRRAFDRLRPEEREKLCTLLPCEESAELLEEMPESQAVEVLEELPAGIAADIVEELPHEIGGDLLREFEADDAAAIFAEIDDAADLQDLQERLTYAEDSAGGLMSDNVVFVRQSSTAGEVLAHLGEKAEEYEDRDVQYVFVTDADEVLTGVIALRNLVLTPRSRKIEDLMIPNPLSVTTETALNPLSPPLLRSNGGSNALASKANS